MRREIPFASLLLRTLLALALMLNGTAVPAAGAMAATANAVTHALHHGHHAMPDQASADDPADTPMTDCCDGKTCGCGCTAPQVVVLQLITTPREWGNSPASPARIDAPQASSPIGAPFRPPA